MEPCTYLSSIDEYLKLEEDLISGNEKKPGPLEQWDFITTAEGVETMVKKEKWENYDTFKGVLKQVREGQTYEGVPLRNKLGWVCYAAQEYYGAYNHLEYGVYEAEAALMWDYKECDKMCTGLNLDFSKVKVHLDWAAGYARAIDRGHSRFCYGGAEEFHPHDLRFANLHVIPEGASGDGQVEQHSQSYSSHHSAGSIAVWFAPLVISVSVFLLRPSRAISPVKLSEAFMYSWYYLRLQSDVPYAQKVCLIG